MLQFFYQSIVGEFISFVYDTQEQEVFMAIKVDYHLHSDHSSDSTAPMEQMVRSAIEKGLTHICFTEHNDFDYVPHPNDPENFFLLNVDSYLYELLRLREKYADQIRVVFGIELGLQQESVRKNAILAKSHEFDFIIASQHVLNTQDPYYPEFWEGKDEKELFRAYFSSILENVKLMPNFDVCGHLDYVVRYSPTKGASYDYREYLDIFDKLFEFLIENEKGIECNTGAYRSGIDMTNPWFGLLKRYRELGGEIITIGSDAHKPEDIGAHFDKAEAFLKEAGFQYYSIFENRIAEYKKLQ